MEKQGGPDSEHLDLMWTLLFTTSVPLSIPVRLSTTLCSIHPLPSEWQTLGRFLPNDSATVRHLQMVLLRFEVRPAYDDVPVWVPLHTHVRPESLGGTE